MVLASPSCLALLHPGGFFEYFVQTSFILGLCLSIMAHDAGEVSSSGSISPVEDGPEKLGPVSHVEQVKSNERVPGHPNYYEKDGLRTYGDEEDHDHEPPVSS